MERRMITAMEDSIELKSFPFDSMEVLNEESRTNGS